MSHESYYPSQPIPLADDRRILEQHHDYVKRLSQTIRRLYASQTPFHLYHGPSFTLRKPRFNTKRVDISHLNRVIHVNTSTRTALVEPGATMADFISATMYHGMMPAVVLEFPGITCGSAFASAGGVSSASFRMGSFEDTVTGIEVVLGNGDVVTKASPHGDRADLFWGCAGGLGSMGVVTMMEIKLAPAMPYVQLSYFVCGSVEEAARAMGREMALTVMSPSSFRGGKRNSNHSSFSRYSDEEFDPRPDFLDAVVFSPEKAVVMVGRLIGAPDDETRIYRFSQRSDPYFYSHVSLIADSALTADLVIPESPSSVSYPAKPNKVEAIALPDYFFRYDRGVFFAGGDRMAKHAHADSPILRALTSRYLRSSPAIRACRRSGLDQVMTSFIASVPQENTAIAVLEAGQDLGVWPVWLCPAKIPALLPNQASHRLSLGRNLGLGSGSPPSTTPGQYTTVFTIGSFGMGKGRSPSQQRQATRNTRQKMEQLGGSVSLLACPFDGESEFWERYDREWHEALRSKYAADRLPSLFERVGTGDQDGKEKPMWMLKTATLVCAVCHLG